MQSDSHLMVICLHDPTCGGRVWWIGMDQSQQNGVQIMETSMVPAFPLSPKGSGFSATLQAIKIDIHNVHRSLLQW